METVGAAAADLVRVADRVQTLDQLGQLLRRLRRRHARRHGTRELTVRELAGRSGYAYGLISDYLNGKVLPPTDRFDVLVRLLGAGLAEQRALATARDRVEDLRRWWRTAGRVPNELPHDVPGFTGRRSELARLDRLLGQAGAGDGEAPVSVVAGTAGVGKTALAVRWAHRVRSEFPDGCLYLDLRGFDPDQPVAPAEALAGFLRSLGVKGTDIPPTEAERAARYRTLLAGRRVLILLDNARDSDQVRQLLPGEARCLTLVTSRDALPGLVTRHGARRIQLDPLTPDEAVALLEELLGSPVTGEPAAARALANRCDRLPLALRLVAQLASTRPGASLAELAAELTDLRRRLDRLDAGTEPRTACRAAFSWSYQHLTAPVATAFRLLGLYPGLDLDAYPLAALAGTDLDQARLRLQQLARAHLIHRTRPTRYGMHDLLRAYATELAAEDPEAERNAALTRLREHQLHASSVAMDRIAAFDRDRRPTIPDPGLPTPPLTETDSALVWLDTERSNLVATAVHAAGPDGTGHAARLAAILVRYLDHGAHNRDAELLHRRAADTADPPARAHALTSLGILYWRRGRFHDAAGQLEQALELARDAGDPNALGRALVGLGIVYWHLGRAARSLNCGQQALGLYRANGDRLGQAWVLGNLGTIHGHLGDYPAAVGLHRRALELFREVGDASGISSELCSLGSIGQILGRFTEALDHLREALISARRAGYRECEAVTLINTGIVYRRLGRLPEALTAHQRALELIRHAGERVSEGRALGYLGTVHALLGDHARAVDHHRRALRIAREIGDHNLTAELLNLLGDTLWSGPHPEEAVGCYREALTTSRERGHRYEQARAHHGLARALTALGDRAAARHWQRALDLYAQVEVPEAGEVRAELAGHRAAGHQLRRKNSQ